MFQIGTALVREMAVSKDTRKLHFYPALGAKPQCIHICCANASKHLAKLTRVLPIEGFCFDSVLKAEYFLSCLYTDILFGHFVTLHNIRLVE